MNHWKYVMFSSPFIGPTIILFPPHLNHTDMANAFSHREVVSAGFVMQGEDGNLVCYGRSDSLKVDSKPEDSVYANLLLHPPG